MLPFNSLHAGAYLDRRARPQLTAAPPPQAFHSSVTFFFSGVACQPWRVMSDVARTGATKRRRERRLHSWWRHKQVSIAAELSAAFHHSRDRRQGKHVGLRAQKTDSAVDVEVVQDAHEAPRGQETPPPGMRPGSLAERLRRSSGELLSYVCQRWLMRRPKPSMVAPSGSSSRSLALKKEEDEERRKVEEKEQLKAAKEKEDPGGWLQAFDSDGDLHGPLLPAPLAR